MKTVECFYRNLSLRLRHIVQEDMEYMGPIRLCEVEEAEAKIIEAAKKVIDWNEVRKRSLCDLK